MRARHMPSAAMLRLGTAVGEDVDERIASVAGDPAYLYELGDALSGWSRKQIQLAAARLTQSGRIVSYGRGTRRLYASARTLDQTTADLSSAQIRILQYMPVAGAVELSQFIRLVSEPGPAIDDMVDAGIILRIAGPKTILMLTAMGSTIRGTLGDGLALPPLTSLRIAELEPEWWTPLRDMAITGSIRSKGADWRYERVLRNGYARRRGASLHITESGRAAYHERLDLMEVTRLLEAGSSSPIEDGIAKRKGQGDRATRAGKGTGIMGKDIAAKAPEPERRLYAYLLMRTDMPSLGLGKSRAQAMHAGNHLTHELYVRPLQKGRKVDQRVIEWHAQGGGFGTAIAIGARNQVTLEVLEKTVAAAGKLGFLAGEVVDGTYPYNVTGEMLGRIDASLHTRPPEPYRTGWRCFCREKTAAWFLGDKSDLETLLARFDLTPHAERERERF